LLSAISALAVQGGVMLLSYLPVILATFALLAVLAFAADAGSG
jgi:hypothetical protein